MKAAPFAYVRPGTVDGVVDELARDGSKVLAGGQSLVPVLAMRLGRPATLVDINAVEELGSLSAGTDELSVGATVRQRRVQLDPAARSVPLLGLALPWVGHREIRSRGTVCGSIAHADPSAELPSVALCLGATLVLASTRGVREVPAEDFFLGPMTTAVEPDEVLIQVRFPVARPGDGFGFGEFARRHGDFALAGVAAWVRTDDGADAAGLTARVACFGVGDRPVVADVTEALTRVVDSVGADAPEAALRTALAAATPDVAAPLVTTSGDAHASASYRRRLLAGLLSRTLARAHRTSFEHRGALS